MVPSGHDQGEGWFGWIRLKPLNIPKKLTLTIPTNLGKRHGTWRLKMPWDVPAMQPAKPHRPAQSGFARRCGHALRIPRERDIMPPGINPLNPIVPNFQHAEDGGWQKKCW
jgi:hypothetical protein